mgnify:CR=1 FL=1
MMLPEIPAIILHSSALLLGKRLVLIAAAVVQVAMLQRENQMLRQIVKNSQTS